MPALYTHWRFGQQVKSTLPPIYQALIEKYPEAFSLGTQGADLLCYHKPLKKNELRSLAPILHDYSGNKFFLGQAKKLVALGEDLQTLFEKEGAYCAYLCGFLCHFALDSACHYYIDSNSNEHITHGKIESEFDKFWLKEDNKPIRGYNTATPILDENGAREAATKTLDIESETAALCIKTMRKINRLFSYKCELFHAVAHLFLGVAGMQRKFGDMFIHKKDDPYFAPHLDTLREQFSNAIPNASAFIQEFFETLPKFVETGKLENELFRYDFSGIIHTEEN